MTLTMRAAGPRIPRSMAEGIEVLRCPCWRAGREDEVIERPSWSDIEKAIERLDGVDYNDLYLDRPDDATWLAIGGGAGRYFVMLTSAAQTDAESWLVACRDGEHGGTELLVVGGQPGNYPARQVVGIESAFLAARDYFATGEPSPALDWEHA